LFVFDFDGVLVDGMEEYWWSARSAALRLLGGPPERSLPEEVPEAFRQLRPLIHKGWEMVLLAAELSRIPPLSVPSTAAAYGQTLDRALQHWVWSPSALQRALEEERANAIARDRSGWLNRHRFYPGVVERLQRLTHEGASWRVLTTKGEAFTRELLGAAGLEPEGLDGHEAGPKTEVLQRLLEEPQTEGRPLWFIEDRRVTLEAVRAMAELSSVRCWLAAWGYLAPGDDRGLADLGIDWLETARFLGPWQSWGPETTATPDTFTADR
jgi:phosphoglycolate phosphatase-like HAD superfamily hydrolase